MPQIQELETSPTPSPVNGATVVPPQEPGWHHVFPESLPELWPVYRSFVLSVIDRGEGSWDERDILAHLLLGKWTMIAVNRGDEPVAVAILEVVDFPRQRKLIVKCVAGDLDLILNSGKDYVEQQALAIGCQVIEMYARRGWEKKLPDYKPARVILRKEFHA